MQAPSIESVVTPLLNLTHTTPPEKMLSSDAQRNNGWWQRRQSLPRQHLNLWQAASGAASSNGGGFSGGSDTESSSSLSTSHQQKLQGGSGGGDHQQQTMLQIPKDERVRVGTANTTVAILQGPHNHAIWKARLLCALNAEHQQTYAAATGALRLDRRQQRQHHDDQQAPGDKIDAAAVEEEQEKKRFHARAIAMITSTLPDETFALVVGQNVDAFKLMEALDARFRPYPRYAGIS